jgi:MFS family permease
MSPANSSVVSAPPAAPGESVKRLLPWLVAVAFFMESLDTTILNTAVPAIAKALAVAPLSMKAVLSSYTLSLAVFIPISGWMADRFGTRRVFSSAIGLFTLGSFLCGISSNIHVLVACRILQGCGGAMMVPVGRLTMVRTFAKSELIRAMSFVAIPGLIGPMLGPIAGGLIVGYFHWRVIFFVNLPIGLLGLYLVYRHLPDYREHSHPLDTIGLILFGSGIALLSYVLEVFGEHTLSGRAMLGLLVISAAASHRLRAAGDPHRVSAAPAGLVSHSDLSRVGQRQLFHPPGHRRNPLPLSAPLPGGPRVYADSIRPPHDAPGRGRHEPEDDDAGILRRFGYRRVLISNTMILGLLIVLFATIGVGTPVWLIVAQAFAFGFFTSLQYTSMNTLVYADVTEEQASSASTIASTMQQMSISFGVATASLATAFFIPDRFHTSAPEMIHGIHQAFLVLGGLTDSLRHCFPRIEKR